MRKLTVLVAMLLVVALAMPVMGASFSDVPSDHWAYDAINKLVAAGVVEGYPDGSFKGEQDMTRYEMAVLISRGLDNINEEREALADKVDSMDEGLSSGQAEDVTAIVESLMEKNIPEDELTEQEAEEVTKLVEALTVEFEEELADLGADVDDLETDMADLQETVDSLKADVPDDNIEFGATIDTMFEVADYGDEPAAAVELWADGDALDIAAPYMDGGDYEAEDDTDFPAEKRFWQEIGIDISGNVGEAEFNLAVDTLTNMFAEEDSVFNDLHSGEYSKTDDSDFVMDSALLEVDYKDYGLKAGDFGGYHMETYLVDDEDMEGLEVTKSVMGWDVKGLVMGDDDDSDADYYGVTASSDMGFGTLTGKVYQVRNVSNDNVTNVAVELSDAGVTDLVTVGGEVVFNDWEERTDGGASESDTLINVNGEFAVTEALTLNGMFETVGADFYAVADDLAGSDSPLASGVVRENVDYDKFELGAEYVLNDNNTVTGSYTMVQPGDDNYTDAAEDQNSISLGLDNTMGKFTNNASVSLTQNDGFTEDLDVRVIELGTEYAWSDSLTVGGLLVNKNEEEDSTNQINYNYLKAFADKKLTENVTWNNELKYITGDVNMDAHSINWPNASGTEVEGESNTFKTSLSVSF